MRIAAAPGESLQAKLPEAGVEFPCGGSGTCGGCRIRVLEGELAITPEMAGWLTPAELAAGWRLACCAHVDRPVVLEVGEPAMPILGDETPVRTAAGPSLAGIGAAIDLGTTTIVAHTLDLATGEVLQSAAELNPQAAHGADIMTRIEFAVRGGAGELRAAIRDTVGRMVGDRPRLVLLAGNTAMHHLFCGIDVASLAAAPFRPAQLGEQLFAPGDLGWHGPADAEIRFLPCLGGFVGSDILAGILATGIAESSDLQALIDLGTNGEIVVGNADRLLCASTAAGPAFEAGRIRMGMCASSGAIAHVAWRFGQLDCRAIGDAPPRGICGSGLVDAVAAALDSGAILPNGRLPAGVFALAPPVSITQSDVRELQMAKGAIAAGLRILADLWGADVAAIQHVHLAGAFGNYVKPESARRIGLLEIAPTRVVAAGNTSLRGVKMALMAPAQRAAQIARIRARTEHIPLASDPRFQDLYAECLGFPKS